jgi:periplasmic protein TonB
MSAGTIACKIFDCGGYLSTVVNLKQTEQNHQQKQIIIKRHSLSPQRLLLLVLVSILIHGLGLLLFARLQRSIHVGEKKADLKPIEFTVLPEESEKNIPEDKTSDNQPPASSAPQPAPAESKTVPPPTPPTPSTPSQPAPAPAPAPAPEPTVKKQTPVLSGSDNASVPQSATTPKPQPKPSARSPESDSVATSLPPANKPAPESGIQPNKPANPDDLSTSANDLLGGDYEKTIASGGDAFFSPEALKYKSVLNPEQLKALKGLDLSQYLAGMEGKVKPNWNPSFRQDERTTVLTFNIEKDGQVTRLKISQSSGADEADREALEAVQKSAPFDPLPANFPLENLEITFSFNIHIY